MDGVYYFTAHILGDQQEKTAFYLHVDGQRRAYTGLLYSGDLDSRTDQAAMMSILLPLNAGQIVEVESHLQMTVHGSNSDGILYSWFTGYLLRAT